MLIILFFLCISVSRFLAQSEQQPPAEKPKTGDSPAQRPAMKLYDVPEAPRGSDEPPDEAADYLKLRQIQDPRQGVVQIEDFLKKYPGSKYETVVRIGAVSLYQQLNDYDKVVEHGEQILAIAPSNYRILTTLALAYMTHGETPKAIEKASKSISALDNLPKPENSADLANWNNERDLHLAMDYAVLGNSSLTEYEQNRKKERETKAAGGDTPSPAASSTAKSPGQGSSSAPTGPAASTPPSSQATVILAKAFGYLSKAVELMPRYDFAQFQLGVVYAYRNDADKAMDAFAKAVAIGGGFAPSAQKNLEAVYKLKHKNSLEGLENLVAKAKEELGPAPSPKAEQSSQSQKAEESSQSQ